MAATVQREVPKTARQRPRPKVVEHLTPAERADAGQGGSGDGAAIGAR